MEKHPQARAPDHVFGLTVSFGDCDPAGIVFYPNFYRWFDACFHDFLSARAEGHAALCTRLGAIGIGLIDSGAAFRNPLRPGDRLTLELRLDRWSSRSLRLAYHGHCDGRLIVEGHELRGIFVEGADGIRAGPMGPLQAILCA
ncbi:MAG: acyl-CoA thioesterase [Alphaproteobacteria bacterium]|nr:MAG: acyl-CoA thioesterase [Alphaproteobacteria bacterium]